MHPQLSRIRAPLRGHGSFAREGHSQLKAITIASRRDGRAASSLVHSGIGGEWDVRLYFGVGHIGLHDVLTKHKKEQ